MSQSTQSTSSDTSILTASTESNPDISTSSQFKESLNSASDKIEKPESPEDSQHSDLDPKEKEAIPRRKAVRKPRKSSSKPKTISETTSDEPSQPSDPELPLSSSISDEDTLEFYYNSDTSFTSGSGESEEEGDSEKPSKKRSRDEVGSMENFFVLEGESDDDDDSDYAPPSPKRVKTLDEKVEEYGKGGVNLVLNKADMIEAALRSLDEVIDLFPYGSARNNLLYRRQSIINAAPLLSAGLKLKIGPFSPAVVIPEEDTSTKPHPCCKEE